VNPGTLIEGRFEIQRLAGRGGMGAVYRALDRSQRTPVAVKILGGLGEGDQARFRQEAQILAELRHPGIVRYVAHGATSDGFPFLALEWLEGEDLDDRLTRGPLPPREALLLARRVADALGAAHHRGIVHRDVKPTNLFLPGGEVSAVKVLDFGVARVGAAPSLTRTGFVVGTPGYVAPEQARGERSIDARADVFALGCVLFACLTGRAPYVAADVLSLLAKVIVEEPPRVRDLWPEAPAALDALVARLMAARADSRPRDGAEAAREIEALGELADLGPSEALSRPRALTTEEMRLVSAIYLDLSRDSDASGAGADDLEGKTVVSDPHPDLTASTLSEQPTLPADTVQAGSPGDKLAAIEATARRFGGRVELLASGSMLVVLHGAGVATDQAARTARCALVLRALRPDARLCLSMGRGTTTGGRFGGDVVERAQSLLRQARADLEKRERPLPVLIDDPSAGLLAKRFVIERAPFGCLLSDERDPEVESHRLLGKSTSCVGRDRELASLTALFDECASEPVARAAVIVGAPGAGKSRLRQELIRRLHARGNELEVWVGRGDVVSAGSPLDLIAQAVRAAAGISGGEPLAERREKLRRRVEKRVAPSESARVCEFLGELTGIPFPSDDSPPLSAARQDAVLMGDQTRRALEDLVAAEASAQPLILVLEDLQWGDLATVRAVDALLRNLHGLPLFVLGTARPEALQIFPGLWEKRNPEIIRAGALTPKASARLVRDVLGASVPEALLERIVARAAGHPLHLEEIVRAVAEGGGDALPDTVLAMVQARIEALEPEARRALRAASIFGRAFWLRGVAALLGEAPPHQGARDWLRELCEREWIAERDAPRFPGEEELSFRQDMAREAAYGMLTEIDRRLGHRLAGDWLERAGEDSGLVLARHFDLGGDAPRAIEAYARAAEQALESDDFGAALEHGDRAIALGAGGEALGRLRLSQAEAQVHRGELEAAQSLADQALPLLPPGEPSWWRAAGAVAHTSGKRGDLARLRAVAADLLAQTLVPISACAAACANAAVQLYLGGEPTLADTMIARLAHLAATSIDPAVQAQGSRVAGIQASFAGNPAETLHHLRAAIAGFEAAGDLRTACAQKKTQGWYAGECGAIEEGERALRESIAVATRMGLANLVAHAKHDIGSPLTRLGKLDEAARFQDEALVAFHAQGDRRLESGAHGVLSWIRRLQGDLPAAEREAREALSIAPSDPLRITALAFLAGALLAAARVDEAIAAAEEGLRILASCGGTEEGVGMLQLAQAEALFAAGRVDEAKQAIAVAKAGVLERAAKISDATLRQSFLDRIAENARILGLAQRWLG
jgi:serine/threonine protein kinase/tetratricopeptide (TPR) repeat protein